MKKLTTRLTIAAAALMVAAGAASAQTQPLTAEIPFAFHVGNRIMEPGTYRVDNLATQSGSPVFRLLEARTHQVVIRIPQAAVDPEKTWTVTGSPKLAFACGDGRCDLAKVWAGSGSNAYTFRLPKPGKDYEASLTVIPMTRDKSE
jgi:hypothetical protein